MLGVQGVAAPRVKKTGTTIVGVVYKVCGRLWSAQPTAVGPQRCATPMRWAFHIPPWAVHAGWRGSGRRHARHRGRDRVR